MSEHDEEAEPVGSYCTCDMPDGIGYCAKHDPDDYEEGTEDVGEAIREAAWQEALILYRRWSSASRRATGGSGGAGYRDPAMRAESARLAVLLHAIIEEHGFHRTYVDPLMPWPKRQAASLECPPAKSERVVTVEVDERTAGFINRGHVDGMSIDGEDL
jgi:hypothetical protein